MDDVAERAPKRLRSHPTPHTTSALVQLPRELTLSHYYFEPVDGAGYAIDMIWCCDNDDARCVGFFHQRVRDLRQKFYARLAQGTRLLDLGAFLADAGQKAAMAAWARATDEFPRLEESMDYVGNARRALVDRSDFSRLGALDLSSQEFAIRLVDEVLFQVGVREGDLDVNRRMELPRAVLIPVHEDGTDAADVRVTAEGAIDAGIQRARDWDQYEERTVSGDRVSFSNKARTKTLHFRVARAEEVDSLPLRAFAGELALAVGALLHDYLRASGLHDVVGWVQKDLAYPYAIGDEYTLLTHDADEVLLWQPSAAAWTYERMPITWEHCKWELQRNENVDATRAKSYRTVLDQCPGELGRPKHYRACHPGDATLPPDHGNLQHALLCALAQARLYLSDGAAAVVAEHATKLACVMPRMVRVQFDYFSSLQALSKTASALRAVFLEVPPPNDGLLGFSSNFAGVRMDDVCALLRLFKPNALILSSSPLVSTQTDATDDDDDDFAFVRELEVSGSVDVANALRLVGRFESLTFVRLTQLQYADTFEKLTFEKLQDADLEQFRAALPPDCELQIL